MRLNDQKKLEIYLQNNNFEFRQIELQLEDRIEMNVKEFVCVTCHRYSIKLDHGKCHSCIEVNSAFRIRLSCLFNEPTSHLVANNGCKKENVPCGLDENIKYCHSKYILYLGILRNEIKVGISRKARKGGYTQRIIEQGFSEAIIINGFPNLMNALQEENWWIQMGFKSRLHFSEKIDDLKQEKVIELKDLFPENLMKLQYPDKEIEYIELNDDINVLDTELGKFPLSGNLTYLSGSFFILNDSEIYDLRDFHNRIIEYLIINGRTII